MSILSTLGAELKALQKLTGPRDPFARTSSFGLGSSLGSSLVSQSNALDLDRLVSDPLHNGVVAACVNAIARALPDAPLLLEQRTPSGWKIVEDHPCLEVLRSPNPDHSDADVWGLTSGYKATRGQAFWLLLPNSRGEVGEIHVWNPDRVTVLGDEEQFISGYRVQRESGTHFLADKRQIIHFRHLPDFSNPRLGWSPLRTGRAQIAGDNVAASYHTSILFNAGVVSLLVSLKEGAMSGQVTPEQFQTVLTNLRRAGRERAGGIEGINLPLEVHKLAYSPDEMNIDRLIEYYETRVCSVMGVSQRVAGLGSDPTYNNLSEALNDFWERRIVPDRNSDAATLNRQWLPLWELDGGSWRFRFDYSNVPALQENRDALHARVRADWEKGLLDKQQARALLGYATENEGEFARVFYGETPGMRTSGDGTFGEVKVWESAKHPRGGNPKNTGEFSSTWGSAGHLASRQVSSSEGSHQATGPMALQDSVHFARSRTGMSSQSATDESSGERIAENKVKAAIDNVSLYSEDKRHKKHKVKAKKVRNVLEWIDKIHRVEDVPRIPAIFDEKTTLEGYIEPGDPWRPVKMGFNVDPSHLEMTAAHEVGHLIDMSGLQVGMTITTASNRKYASAHAEELAGFRKAVDNSQATQKLRALHEAGEFVDNKGEIQKLKLGRIGADVEYHELWARAYAQYIAVKSGQPVMKEQLEEMLNNTPYHRNLQWSDEDFAPIAAEIDKLFQSKGWI